MAENGHSPRRYPYFYVAVGVEWSNGPESYGGGSVATGTAFHAGQVKGDAQDKERCPPGWGLGVGLPLLIKLRSVEKLLKKEEAKVHQRL